MMTLALSFALGLFAWTLLEYGLHRFAGHGRGVNKHVKREHLQHHATPDYFTSFGRKLVLAIPVVGSLFGLATLIASLPAGIGLAAGVCAGWGYYDLLHKRIHVRGPRGRYGEWARRHHLHHHFQNPRVNHGVTTPLWDWVFGTLEVPETVAVPRRHVRCFAWLLDESQEAVAEPYASVYRLR